MIHDPLRAPTVTRRAVVVDVVMAAVCVAVTALSSGLGVAGFVGGLMIAGALACRTRLPTAALLVAVASCVLQLVVGQGAPLAWLGYAPLVYFFAAHPRGTVRFGSAVVVLVVACAAGWSIRDLIAPGTALGQQNTAVVVAVCSLLFAGPAMLLWALGYIGFQRRAALIKEFTARQVDAERRQAIERLGVEEERNEIARDIHDVVAHSLTVVVAQAEGARYQLDHSPEAARRALEVIAQTGRSSLTDVRVFLEQLRHRNIPTDGRSYRESRDFLLEQFRAAGLTVHLSVSGALGDAPGLVSVTLYRVLAEALTNALKHGDLRDPVHITEIWGLADVHLVVRNSIPATDQHSDGTSMGMSSILERVALARGSVTAGAVDGAWVLEARLPTGSATSSEQASSEGEDG